MKGEGYLLKVVQILVDALKKSACKVTVCIFNNYSPKAKLILLNNPRDEVEGIIQR